MKSKIHNPTNGETDVTTGFQNDRRVNYWPGLLAALMICALTSAASEQLPPTRLLHGHVPAVIRKSHLIPVGTLTATQQLDLVMTLPHRNEAVLKDLLEQMYNPASPKYRHYLTPQQFVAQFGPSEKDYTDVLAFAKSSRLAIRRTVPSRSLVDVTGSVADIENAFKFKLRLYQDPNAARQFYAPDAEPSIGGDLPIQHISGLDNCALRPHTVAQVSPIKRDLPPPPGKSGQGGSPLIGSGQNGEYFGNDFRNAYVGNTTLNGAGQVVGLMEVGNGFTPSDITYYENLMPSKPGVKVQVILCGGLSTAFPEIGGYAEAPMDIELVIAMAPSLKQVSVYEANNQDDALDEMAYPTQGEPLPLQMSSSWFDLLTSSTAGYCEQFAAQRQTFFEAAGDTGSDVGGDPDNLIDCPDVTIVGGTMLTTSGSGQWQSEVVWNDNDGVNATGGGYIEAVSIPSYQSGTSMAQNGGSTSYRNFPDVAAVATEIEVVHTDANGNINQVTVGGGTSASAPLWAGFAALVNEEAANPIYNTGPIGFINPAIYAIGNSPNYQYYFHDITSGNNSISGDPSHFSAVPGFDLCTGWGTPNGAGGLIEALAGVPVGTWTILSGPGATMNNARYYHTATLLTDGTVLVAGGTQPGGPPLSSTELFTPSPSGGSWAPSGTVPAMTYARSSHTATLLTNGLVLVAGGDAAGNTAEIYFPPSNGGPGTWVPTVNTMASPRFNHTATLLPNGRVLVAGGGPWGLNTAELYIPAANGYLGRWQSTGSMKYARTGHTATLLSNGDVLVAGGYNGDDVAQAEIYSWSSGTWTTVNAGTLITPRDGHTATLLPNGNVLVAGGEDSRQNALNAYDLYSISAGSWTEPGVGTTYSVWQPTATLLPYGQVLVAGGDLESGNRDWAQGTAELYNADPGIWTVTGSLNTPRYGHTATLLNNGLVLVAGGLTTGNNSPQERPQEVTYSALNSAELFDVGLGYNSSWQPQITSVNSPLTLNSSLKLTGTGFEGPPGTSPTESPVVQLLSLGNQQTYSPVPASFTATTFTSEVVPNTAFPPGWALVTVFVNGIPSRSTMVNVQVPLGVTPYIFKSGSSMRRDHSFQASFTNYAGLDFKVLMTTNLAVSISNWTALNNGVMEVSPGQYRFTDLQASNSPQRFYIASGQVGAIYSGNDIEHYIGNSSSDMSARSNSAPDSHAPLVILGEYNPSGPLPTTATPLPAGTVEDVRFYGSNYNFTLYGLAYVSRGSESNEQTFQVVASQNFSGSAATAGIQTLPVSGFSINAGDFLAFAGIGPWYPQVSNDVVSSDATYEDSSNPGSFTATPPGGVGTRFTVGVNPDRNANYEYVSDAYGNQGRTYAIGVDVTTLPLVTPPAIHSIYPPALTERAGDHVAYTAQATGNGTLTYQWSFTPDNVSYVLLGGQTGPSLVLTNIQTADSGTYWVTVTDITGILVSNAVTLNVSTNYLPLSPTNLVVVRLGDGVQTLSSNGNTIFLDQYSVNGRTHTYAGCRYVSSTMIPDENNGAAYGTGSSSSATAGLALLLPGGAPTASFTGVGASDYDYEGFLTLSSNQKALILAGYNEAYPFDNQGSDVTAGGAGFARGIYTITASGLHTLAYTNDGLYSAGNHSIRSAGSTDGATNFWATGQAGTASGVKYVSVTNLIYADGSGIPAIAASTTGPRVVQVLGTNLVFSDTGGASGAGLYATIGTPEPGANAPTTPSTIILSEGGHPMDFAASPDLATIYIADDQPFTSTNAGPGGGGIQRFDTTTPGTNYAYSYTLPASVGATNGARCLTADFSVTNTWGPGVIGAVLYATTASSSGNSLVQVVDTGSASTPAMLVTAGTNEVLRGVRFGPMPP